MKTGAIILAASKSKNTVFSPLVELDGITVIKRIIITLKRSGISPITVITGEQGNAVEKEISKLQVISLRSQNYRETYMFDHVCTGLRYMEDLCDRTFILPAKFPSLLSDTMEKMMSECSLCVRPSFQGCSGHPILLDRRIFSDILSYSGDKGLRGALLQPKIRSHTTFVPVADSGIILTAEDVKKNIYPSDAEESFPIYPSCELVLNREEVFFNQETARFLTLIAHTGSMQSACRQMQISYSKGLKMIKHLETHLSFPILSTHSGGASGGSSSLTPEATAFLKKYTEVQERLAKYTIKLYKEYFS